MTQRIFVYGTLKRGLENSHFMLNQRFVGEARTQPRYRMYDCGGYPGMMPVDSNGLSIHGEVWEVNAEGRAALDVLEDVEVGLYSLLPVKLLAPFNGENVLTYIYAWPLEGKTDVGDVWK